MASAKIQKPGGAQADESELKIAEEIYKLEQGSPELKADLENLYILGAKEVSTPGGKKAVILMVPFTLLGSFRKIQTRLVRELEKKLQVGFRFGPRERIGVRWKDEVANKAVWLVAKEKEPCVLVETNLWILPVHCLYTTRAVVVLL